MSKSSEGVKSWRKRTKHKIISGFGGKCCICGYNRYIGSLELHHVDKATKDGTLSSMMNDKSCSWEKIVKECRKCILVCSNCHKEIHGEIIKLSGKEPRFEISKSGYEEEVTCPICGGAKRVQSKTCSNKCASKRINGIVTLDFLKEHWGKISLSSMSAISRVKETEIRSQAKKYGLIDDNGYIPRDYRRKVTRPNIEVLMEDIKNLGFCGTGRKYGVSDNAIRKWVKTKETARF